MPGERERPPFPPGLAVALAVASVSFAAPLFRLAAAPPLTATFWRLALAVALLLPFTRGAWQRWRRYGARAWGLVAATGVALALHFALWVESLGLTTVAAATSLVTMQAVFVALGGHFLLRDRLGGRHWVGVAVAVGGALTIAFSDAHGAAPQRWWGDVLALVAGLGSAVYLLVGRRLRSDRALVEYVVPVYAAAALALGIAALILRAPLTSGLDARSGTLFLLLAAVPMLGGHTLANWVLRYLPAHTVATWILLEPVGAALIAWVLPQIRETPPAATILGGFVILAGASLTIPRRPVVAEEPAG
ncbi:MAG: DMT family transporter [Thermoplasmatota archaeon]